MIPVLPLVFVALLVAVPVTARAVDGPLDPGKLRLMSANAVIFDPADGKSIYMKAANEVTPIASLTKLMTAMVVLDAGQPLDESLDIDMDDFDYLKGSRSRLRMGSTLSRDEMLRLALMSSENRAASTLARHYPGGAAAFVTAMNVKAKLLGLANTHFEDPTGLSPRNVSTANDLARMVQAASDYPLIRDYSTTPAHHVEIRPTGQMLGFNNSNALVKNGAWDIKLQKTGYIREAGRCVVMLATIASRPMVIVLLDSIGKYTRLGDAQRVKHWLETGETLSSSAVRPTVARAPQKGGQRRKGTVQPVASGSQSPRGDAPDPRGAAAATARWPFSCLGTEQGKRAGRRRFPPLRSLRPPSATACAVRRVPARAPGSWR
jgi:D-alanyl-D-alanine endopeptidase (penicillin-binding protein 7)